MKELSVRANGKLMERADIGGSQKSDASGKQKLRIVIDFRKLLLNNLTIRDSYPLPNITDILDQLGSAKYFLTLDLTSGYHQIAREIKIKQRSPRHMGITSLIECHSA